MPVGTLPVLFIEGERKLSAKHLLNLPMRQRVKKMRMKTKTQIGKWRTQRNKSSRELIKPNKMFTSLFWTGCHFPLPLEDLKMFPLEIFQSWKSQVKNYPFTKNPFLTNSCNVCQCFYLLHFWWGLKMLSLALQNFLVWRAFGRQYWFNLNTENLLQATQTCYGHSTLNMVRDKHNVCNKLWKK